jgi:hypothetical protein
VLLALILVNAAAIAAIRVYPFVDLPFHLSAATIYRDYRAADAVFPRYFVLAPLFPEPNVAHLLLAAAPFFPGVEAANRVLLVLYFVAVPLVTKSIVERLGGDPWSALLSILLLYNFNIAWGFAGYLLAIPLVLVFLRVLIDFTERTRRRDVILLAVIVVLLFFAHVLAMLFAVTVLAVASALVPPRRRQIPRALVAMLPGLALLAWWWAGRNEPSTAAFLTRYYRNEYFPTWWATRRRLLTHDNAQLFAGRAGTLAALVFAAAILMPPLLAMRSRVAGIAGLWRRPGARAVVSFGCVAMACGLVLPDRIPAQSALYERFSVFALLAFVFLGALVLPNPLPRRQVIAICLAATAYTGLRLEYLRAFAADTRSFTADVLPPGGDSTLFAVIHASRFRGLPVYTHFPDYYTVWRHGIAATELTQFRFGVIRPQPGGPRLPFYDTSPHPRVDLRQYAGVDYLLMRSRQAPQEITGFSLEKESGEWTLYKNVKLAN